MNKKHSKLQKSVAIGLYPFALVVTQSTNPFIKNKRKRINFKKLNRGYKYYLSH